MAARKLFRDYTALSTASAELILKNLPFFFFLSFLAIIYIANTHYSEKKITQIQTLELEVKHLRWHYMSMKSQVMYNSKQSEVERGVNDSGLKAATRKPWKIVVPKEE